MTTQHTPTPWRVEEDKKNLIAATSPGFFLDPVARCNVSGVHEADKANAAFIVLACNAHEELLAALKKASYYLDGASSGHANAYRLVMAAIAKAVAK